MSSEVRSRARSIGNDQFRRHRLVVLKNIIQIVGERGGFFASFQDLGPFWAWIIGTNFSGCA
jgi:hypothetical protein